MNIFTFCKQAFPEYLNIKTGPFLDMQYYCDNKHRVNYLAIDNHTLFSLCIYITVSHYPIMVKSYGILSVNT